MAVVYGAAGNVGSAVARTFAREGARLFLVGRTLASVEGVAAAIRAAGGTAEAAAVDALDIGAVEAHLTALVAATGASDRAGAMTGTIVNLTCGSIMNAT